MATTYLVSSPYSITKPVGNYLDILNFRQIPKEPDDVIYSIKSQHAYRPDLLAFDLYGDQNLWWVFAQRNPNSIEDPIFDFREGVSIYLPKLKTLERVLGL